MSESEDLFLFRRLNLSDDTDDAEIDHGSFIQSNRQVDGISSLVALAFEREIQIFEPQPKFKPARIGSGTFSTIDYIPMARHHHPAKQVLVVKRYEGRGSVRLWPAIAKEIRILGHPFLRCHPNIVDIIGLSWTGLITDHNQESEYRWPCLLMEYADCGTLEDFFTLEGVDFTWELKVEISYDIAQGLEALHSSGIVHGDLKPPNILVFRTGFNSFKAKLCDFGSAIISNDLSKNRSVQPTVLTPPWNAPESLQNIQHANLYKIDIYSYGLVLCSVFLEGESPFQGKFQPMPKLMHASVESMIKLWKEDDKVFIVCKFAVRNFGRKQYAPQQLALLDKLFDVTARTDINRRVHNFSEIKSIFRLDLASNSSEKR